MLPEFRHVKDVDGELTFGHMLVDNFVSVESGIRVLREKCVKDEVKAPGGPENTGQVVQDHESRWLLTKEREGLVEGGLLQSLIDELVQLFTLFFLILDFVKNLAKRF